MKIGMLVNNLCVSGGYQKLVLRLSLNLINMGHDVVIYTLSADKEKCYPELIRSVSVVYFQDCETSAQPSSIAGSSRFPKQIEAILNFKNLVRLIDKDLDAMIIHGPLCLHGLNFLRHRKKIKIVWMANNQIDDFDNMRSLISSVLNDLPAISFSIFKVLRDFSLVLLSFLVRVIEILSYKNGIRFVDTIAVYDEINRQIAIRKYGKSRDIVIVYAGADLDVFNRFFRERTFSKNKRISILSVGVLFPHRRYEDIITAIEVLRKQDFDVRLSMVGLHYWAPVYYLALKKLVIDCKLEEHVQFVEYLPEDELYRLYRESDVFIFVNDGFTWGIAVFEAIAAGLPVIISDNIGAADLIQNKVHGWVVNPRSPEQIAMAVQEIAQNTEHTVEITYNAWHHIRNIVSWSAYSERMLMLLKS